MLKLVKNDLLLMREGLIIAGGLLLLGAIVTAPIWVPEMLGIETANCECGARFTPSGVSPYCKCYY